MDTVKMESLARERTHEWFYAVETSHSFIARNSINNFGFSYDCPLLFLMEKEIALKESTTYAGNWSRFLQIEF